MTDHETIQRLLHVGPYRLPMHKRMYERVCDWLGDGYRPLRGLAVAMVVGGGLWWLLIWAAVSGYRLVGR